MRKILFSIILLLPQILLAQSSNCDYCYLCEWVYNSRGQKVLYHTLDNAEGMSGGLFSVKEDHRRTGSFDNDCLARVKAQKEKEAAEEAKFEKSKERIKNGETVVEWYASGKAKKSMKNPNDVFNHITWYYESGKISEKFSDNIFYLYDEKGVINKGPGIAKNEYGSIAYYLHGIWIFNNEMKIIQYGKDVTQAFYQKLKQANTIEEIEEIQKEFVYNELAGSIENRKKEIIADNIYRSEYLKKYNQALDEFTYEGFKKFNQAYPDSAVGFTKRLMDLLNPDKSTDTIIFVFYNNDFTKLKALDRILFDKIIDKKYCQTNDKEKLLINCFLSPNIEWLSNRCKYSRDEVYKAEIDVFRENGLIKKALLFSNINGAVGKVTYNSNLTSVTYRSYDCSEAGKIVYYKAGKEYFSIYDNKDKIVYKDINTGEEKVYGYVHYYGQSLYGDEKKTLNQFYSEAGPEVFNAFFNNFFHDGKSNLKKRTGYEELKFISSDIDFFSFLISTQFQQSPFNFNQSQFYSDRAIEYIKNYESSALATQALWNFEILKSFSYWMSNQPDKAVEMISARCSESYTEPGRKVYNGTGSPSYTADIKLKYMDEVRRIYKIFEDAGIIFPTQKETWKKIKSLK